MSDSKKSEPVNDEQGTTKPGGVGKDGTIPADPKGVAAGYTGEESTFEPEEDTNEPEQDTNEL